MNLKAIEKCCQYYSKFSMLKSEKKLLRTVLKSYTDWQWGIQRIKELDLTFGQNHVTEKEAKPLTKKEIAHSSFQYQKEWRFEREKSLIEHALTLFPDWKYLHNRMEWHARPVFHIDPEKSKTQPRKSLNLSRDPQYIPKQKSIDSMCFVTGTSSNAPYFDLCVQLIESIKATLFYNHVPIKILDCGLTKEDADYLRKRFGCEVKDPGLLIPLEYTDQKNNDVKTTMSGLKSMVARHHIHKIFPKYKYYCWFDCDTWIQSENCIDAFLSVAEEQGFCVSTYFWSYGAYGDANFHKKFLPKDVYERLKGKNHVTGSFFIGNVEFMKHYNKFALDTINRTKKFAYGSDDALLGYTAYQLKKYPICLHHHTYNSVFSYAEITWTGVEINQDKAIMISDRFLGLVNLCSHAKKFHHTFLFRDVQLPDLVNWHFKITNDFQDLIETIEYYSGVKDFEEKIFNLCNENNINQGSYFYRIYPSPEDLYGSISSVLK